MLFRLLLVTCLFAAPSWAAASVVENMSVGRVLLDQQSADAEKEALSKAFEQVFIKMSGSKRVTNNIALQQALEDAQSYLISSAIVRQGDLLLFEARFNQQAVEGILKAAGAPLWANLRPTSTLWLAKQNAQGDVQWFSQNAAQDFNFALQQFAFERGINMILPLGDLADAMNVSEYDVWNQNTTRLQEHSKRYDSPYIISATMKALTDNMRQQKQEEYEFISQQQALENIMRTDLEDDSASAPSAAAHYELNWIIKGPNNEMYSGQGFVMNEAQAASDVINAYADILANQFALRTQLSEGDMTQATILFENIRSIGDYNKAMNLLESMPQITSASLLRVQSDDAYFSVKLIGSSSDFEALLQIDPRVAQASEDSNVVVSKQADIHFIWQP